MKRTSLSLVPVRLGMVQSGVSISIFARDLLRTVDADQRGMSGRTSAHYIVKIAIL